MNLIRFLIDGTFFPFFIPIQIELHPDDLSTIELIVFCSNHSWIFEESFKLLIFQS